MPEDDDASKKLETGVDQLVRLVDSQIESVHQVQARVGVLLGFDATAIGLIFTLGRGWLSAHGNVAVVAAVPLFVSAAIFGWAMAVRKLEIGPKPVDVIDALKDPGTDNKTILRGLASEFSGIVTRNTAKIKWSVILVHCP